MDAWRDSELWEGIGVIALEVPPSHRHHLRADLAPGDPFKVWFAHGEIAGIIMSAEALDDGGWHVELSVTADEARNFRALCDENGNELMPLDR